MIQDIAPSQLDIAYHPYTPEENSYVLFFCKEELLVLQKQEDTEIIGFPTYAQVKEFCTECTYLFSLDNRRFFHAIISESDVKSISGSLKTRKFFRTAKQKELAFAAITAMHLHGWYQKNRFCGVCGARTMQDDKERMLRCPTCGNMIFPRINPAVIVGVTNGDRLLLTKYRDREYKRYALIAGFNEIGETLEDTVRREVMEEAGLCVKNIRYYKSQPWGFSDNILVGYFCEVDGDDTITMDENELSVAEWVAREDIPVKPEDLSLTNEMICRFLVDK